MAIETVHLENFSLFSDFTLEVSPSINVIIGENGTGKTHILKAIYATCNFAQKEDSEDYFPYFTLENRKSLLKDRLRPSAIVSVMGEYGTEHKKTIAHSMTLLRHAPISQEPKDTSSFELIYPTKIMPSVYIPVKDMLTHSKGLLEMAEKYKGFPFDKTLLDVVRIAKRLPLKQPPELARAILPKLEAMIDGTVDYDDDEFFVRKHDGRKVNFSIEAEGFKKIGLLWQLLMNESITPGSVLLWDEPDANLNPKFLPTLVDCLLELSRHDVQIFLGTHSYLLAKYFDVKRQNNDALKFHSLYQKKNDIACETGDTFVDLKHNAIMEAFDALVGEVYGIKMD